MRTLWALLLILVTSASAFAQDYPTHNVIFVVPTGAGAATDLLARILAPSLPIGWANPLSSKIGPARVP